MQTPRTVPRKERECRSQGSRCGTRMSGTARQRRVVRGLALPKAPCARPREAVERSRRANRNRRATPTASLRKRRIGPGKENGKNNQMQLAEKTEKKTSWSFRERNHGPVRFPEHAHTDGRRQGTAHPRSAAGNALRARRGIESVSPLKKVKPEVSGKKRVFSAKRQAVWFEARSVSNWNCSRQVLAVSPPAVKSRPAVPEVGNNAVFPGFRHHSRHRALP